MRRRKERRFSHLGVIFNVISIFIDVTVSVETSIPSACFHRNKFDNNDIGYFHQNIFLISKIAKFHRQVGMLFTEIQMEYKCQDRSWKTMIVRAY